LPVRQAEVLRPEAPRPVAARPPAPAKPAATEVRQTALLQREPLLPGQAAPRPLPGNEYVEIYQPLGPPGPDRLFRLESEKAVFERMRQTEFNRTGQRIIFPVEPVVSKETYMDRHFPPATELAEPYYVCYLRLYFQDLNSERYGWDLGIIQPVVSALLFYKDWLLFPYHASTRPCQHFECSAGYCLPGDPVPYLCYPPEISLTGALNEGAALGVVLAAFP
jgi:hypothetical protein